MRKHCQKTPRRFLAMGCVTWKLFRNITRYSSMGTENYSRTQTGKTRIWPRVLPRFDAPMHAADYPALISVVLNSSNLPAVRPPPRGYDTCQKISTESQPGPPSDKRGYFLPHPPKNSFTIARGQPDTKRISFSSIWDTPTSMFCS